MRTIALSFACALFCAALGAAPAPKPVDTPYARIAKLASYLSDGQPVGVLEAFDRNMPRYGAIAEDIQALASLSEVLCSIDVVEDKEADNAAAEIHHLDLDWYMTLKSRANPSLVESRRQRVAVTIQRQKTKAGQVWKITSLSPETILAAITIK